MIILNLMFSVVLVSIGAYCLEDGSGRKIGKKRRNLGVACIGLGAILLVISFFIK